MSILTRCRAVSKRSVIRGTSLIYNYVARILIDTGSSHSFVLYALTYIIRLRFKALRTPQSVTTPVPENIVLDHICRSCTMVIAEYENTFNLILLDMVELDVIIRNELVS